MEKIILLWTLTGLINGIFPAISIDRTLTRRYGRIRTVLVWLVLLAVGFFVNFYLYSRNLFDDTRMAVVIVFLLLLGTWFLYDDLTECKAFLSIGLFLSAIVVTFMFCGTTDTILGGMFNLFDPDLGPYTVRNIIFFASIKLVVFVIFHCIYIYLLKDRTRRMLFHAGNKMRVYLVAPVISLIALNMIMFTTNAIGIVPASFNFFMLYVPICAVFVMEFVHIYMSVQWATEVIKTGKLIRLDGLTGLNNRISFTEATEKLDQKLQSGPVSFGVAVFDLNDLKEINDTYGHEKGDIAIFTLSDIISKVFTDCDCYRIGGDEFAVIASEKRVDRMDVMVREFKEILRDNRDSESWKHISAAVGYAVFDNDSNFQSVFNRADQDMYNHKVEMKAAE